MSEISMIESKRYNDQTTIQFPAINAYGHLAASSAPCQSNAKTAITQEINRPKHYGSKSGRDVIEWCEDFGLMENAYIFNIFKYLCRAGKKSENSELQDAMKAKVYLDRYIESLKKVC